MRFISESTAIERLGAIRREFTEVIRSKFEHRALPCSECKTPGACCLDEHFVNVRITRLEAKAIERRLNEMPDELQQRVEARISDAVEGYKLRDPQNDRKVFACPLFEKGIGCLVHHTAKPLPCIAHACYERKEFLPPDELLSEQEIEIDKLNWRTYGESVQLPLPLALVVYASFFRRRSAIAAPESSHPTT